MCSFYDCCSTFSIKVQRWRVRQSIQRVDPTGVSQRREQASRRISRRVYGNPHPHYCWHIDGNHKLIRWKLVVHAAIDGFSRACVYLRCSNNNQAWTVLQNFTAACEEFSCVPRRIRTDYGGENQLLWEAMMELADETNPYPVTVGASVHNQRIERFNRDINNHVKNRFGIIFRYLEQNGQLNVEDPVHIYALHVVFIPRINATLDAFRVSHNNHPIRTEGNLSPIQLIESYDNEDFLEASNEPQLESMTLPPNPTIVSIEPPQMEINEEIRQRLENLDVTADDGADGVNCYATVLEILIANTNSEN